jgi:16S rRNA C967 or C1407 C5-methylase (RsmB/RsmF family)
MRKAAAALFPESPGEQSDFLAALTDPQPRGTAILWIREKRAEAFAISPRDEQSSWLPEEVDILVPGTKVGQSGPFLEGEIYSFDLSSVAMGSAIREACTWLPEHPRVLDLCAAPGGKSIMASRWLAPGLLLANEVEARRLGILRQNLQRCRIPHAYLSKLTPDALSVAAPAAFDFVLVDAPCSGQSLLAKGQNNLGCFHPSIIKGNAKRQLGILLAAGDLVREGGGLLYTTCTFSEKENEGVVEKFLTRRSDFSAVPVSHLETLRSPFTDHPGYRIYPHRFPGAGGFACLLRRHGERQASLPELPASLLAYPVTADESTTSSAVID